jgi:hypothetical protein
MCNSNHKYSTTDLSSAPNSPSYQNLSHRLTNMRISTTWLLLFLAGFAAANPITPRGDISYNVNAPNGNTSLAIRNEPPWGHSYAYNGDMYGPNNKEEMEIEGCHNFKLDIIKFRTEDNIKCTFFRYLRPHLQSLMNMAFSSE